MEPNNPILVRLNNLISKGQDIATTEVYHEYGSEVNPGILDAWLSEVDQFFQDNLNENNAFIKKFRQKMFSSTVWSRDRNFVEGGLYLLQSLKEYLIDHIESPKKDTREAFLNIELICIRFPLIVRQLRRRHKGEPTLNVKNEYDVQDLLHVLLSLFFDDIRPEEVSPSYAGGSSRMDFLLKKERIVIETKMTRHEKCSQDKRIGDELLQDIERYKMHPECSTLICFIYDPEGWIRNAAGLKQDLELKCTSNFNVKVHIIT